MRSPTVRRTLRLTVTLLGLEPPVWRELVASPDLSLGELHDAIALSLGWPTAAHHVFSDEGPELYDDDPVFSEHVGYRPPHRYGDRWTMIDWRDPDVIEESSVTVGDLVATGPLFYACDVAGLWWMHVQLRDDALEAAAAPLARLTTGSGRAPLPGGPGPSALPRLHTILADASHPEHADTVAAFAAAVGPWSAYRPAAADLDGAREAVAARFRSEPLGARHPALHPSAPATRLDALVAAAPLAARDGLRAHLQHSLPAIDEPPAPALIVEVLRPLSWLLQTIGDDGAALHDGFLHGAVADAAARELGYDGPALRALVVEARALGLVRRFRGRLVPLVAARALRDAPTALWDHLTTAIWNRDSSMWGWRDTDHTTALLLLSIADGTLADPDAGAAHFAAARETFRVAHEWTSRSSFDELDGWDALTFETAPRGTSPSVDGGTSSDPVAETDAAAPLRLLGLARTTGGGWATPPGLRAFARAALARPRLFGRF